MLSSLVFITKALSLGAAPHHGDTANIEHQVIHGAQYNAYFN